MSRLMPLDERFHERSLTPDRVRQAQGSRNAVTRVVLTIVRMSEFAPVLGDPRAIADAVLRRGRLAAARPLRRPRSDTEAVQM
jgi:hypothetical protein